MNELAERPRGVYRHPAEADLDTAEEQAQALLRDLRESFSPSYLTLISIIEGVLLGLMFELVAAAHAAHALQDMIGLAMLNNLLLIMIVWNEYRMGSSMFHWVPALPDAVIPFVLGVFQAALILTQAQPMTWLAWLATFYAAAIIAYHNMYHRSAEEERNTFVLERNHGFQRLNMASCLFFSAFMWTLFLYHRAQGTVPGWRTLSLVTVLNVLFLLRGEANWRMILGAARTAAAPASRHAGGPRIPRWHRVKQS